MKPSVSILIFGQQTGLERATEVTRKTQDAPVLDEGNERSMDDNSVSHLEGRLTAAFSFFVNSLS